MNKTLVANDTLSRKLKNGSLFICLTVIMAGCQGGKSVESREILDYQARNKAPRDLGQVRFMLDSLGTFSLKGLSSNIIPVKVYSTALLIMEEKEGRGPVDSRKLPEVMEKFGFIRAEGIANWDSARAPEPKTAGSFGYLHGDLDEKVFGQRIKIELGNITCGTCHGGVSYDSQGLPTKKVWLGSPNTSLNLDAYLDRIYKGLIEGSKDNSVFLTKIRQAYPDMDPAEAKTIETQILPLVSKEIKKLKPMGHVFPFPNGGPGVTNGISAFKRNAEIVDKYTYDAQEAGFVSIPLIADRGFRSSLTYDGAYGVPNTNRYHEVQEAEAKDPSHLSNLAELAAYFSYSAMGNQMESIEGIIPRVKEIFGWLKDAKAQKFPGKIRSELLAGGAQVYSNACAKCHGVYTADLGGPKLVSFPNVLSLDKDMKTDPLRWFTLTQDIVDFANKNAISKFVDSTTTKGYVAPLLSGIWMTAPYLHNGSVPTLWDLMHPAQRPAQFMVGGHAVDFDKVGVSYPKGYKPWSAPQPYNTREPGRSNRGHETEFEGLTEQDKASLLEYLKLL